MTVLFSHIRDECSQENALTTINCTHSVLSRRSVSQPFLFGGLWPVLFHAVFLACDFLDPAPPPRSLEPKQPSFPHFCSKVDPISEAWVVHKEGWNLDYSDKRTFPVGWRQELSKAEILQRWRAFLAKARVPVWKEDCSFLTEAYIQWECSAHSLVPEGDPVTQLIGSQLLLIIQKWPQQNDSFQTLTSVWLSPPPPHPMQLLPDIPGCPR